jgi:hypothetical protein
MNYLLDQSAVDVKVNDVTDSAELLVITTLNLHWLYGKWRCLQ